MVESIRPDRLAALLDSSENVPVIDTREPESFDAWRIPGARNVPFDPRESLDVPQRKRVEELSDDGGPIVTVCGKGISSGAFATALGDAGFDDIRVVTGGMEGWAELHETVTIPSDRAVVRQLQRRATGCLGYLVGCADAGVGVVVDPTRGTEAYNAAAGEAGLRIERVIDTHVHADHVSGGPRLAEELDVPYHLPAAAEERVERSFEPIADGETITVGSVELTALHAPGHTSDLTAFRIDDDALLTADALFVDGVGRTELQFGEAGAAEGARTLYSSLHDVVLAQPDDYTVLPGHVTVANDGTWQGGTPGTPVAASLGDLRAGLGVLGLDEAEFVDRVTGRDPEKPANYEEIVGLNAGIEPMPPEHELRELETGPNSCAA